jgi:hypothetical protein
MQNWHADLKYFSFYRRIKKIMGSIAKQKLLFADVPKLDEQLGGEAPSELSLLGPLRWDHHLPGDQRFSKLSINNMKNATHFLQLEGKTVQFFYKHSLETINLFFTLFWLLRRKISKCRK